MAKVTCLECGKEFGRITASHVKTHDMTYEDYLAKHAPDKLEQKKELADIVDFFFNYYITVRKKYLLYPNNEQHPVTVNAYTNDAAVRINKNTLTGHLTGRHTIGIFFPSKVTKVIGFDIDVYDNDLLHRLHDTLVAYGIDETAMLLSYSGGKGYHVDVLLDGMVSSESVDMFYKIVLKDLAVLPSVIELRGGTNNSGYKLPLGYHQKTGAFCYVCDDYGNRVQNYSHVLKTRTKANKDVIAIVTETFGEEDALNEQEALEVAEMVNSVTLPARTEEGMLEAVRNLWRHGVHEVGYRTNSIFKVAMYLKDYESMNADECIKAITEWISSKWSPSVVDKEIIEQAKRTVKDVYKHDKQLKFNENSANTLAQVSTADLKEILTVKTRNKLQTNALRRTYYVLLVHSRSVDGGVFYMTYERMASYGLSTDCRRIKQHIEKLAELEKVEIIRQGAKRDKGYRKLPNQYNLPMFDGKAVTGNGKIFTMCGRVEKCANCFERAACHLLTARERSAVIKGKEYKAVGECPESCNQG